MCLAFILLEAFGSSNYYILVVISLISIIIQVITHPTIYAIKSLKTGSVTNKIYCLYLIILHLSILVVMLILCASGLACAFSTFIKLLIKNYLTIFISWALVFVCLKIGLCIGIILDTELLNKFQIIVNVICAIFSLIAFSLLTKNSLWSLFLIPKNFPSTKGNPAIFISIVLFSQIGWGLYKIFKPKKVI